MTGVGGLLHGNQSAAGRCVEAALLYRRLKITGVKDGYNLSFTPVIPPSPRMASGLLAEGEGGRRVIFSPGLG